jgi:hypothetical protein
MFCPYDYVGRDSSVGIATRYGVDGPGIESQWVKIFCTCSDRPWGPPSFFYNGYRVFLGGKVAGAWRWPPTTSSAEVKERVKLYIYSPSGPSWPVLGWPLPLPLPYDFIMQINSNLHCIYLYPVSCLPVFCGHMTYILQRTSEMSPLVSQLSRLAVLWKPISHTATTLLNSNYMSLLLMPNVGPVTSFGYRVALFWDDLVV